MTGSFAGKGKLACWKAFLEADSVCVDAPSRPWGNLTASTLNLGCRTEACVLAVHFPGTQISSVKERRWFLFQRKHAESERLPPNKAALKQAILRAITKQWYRRMI